MSLTDEEEKTLKHDIRNQLSNIVMTLSELKHINPERDDYQIFLYKTIDDCCRNIDHLLIKNT